MATNHKEYIIELIAADEITIAIKEFLNGTRDHQPRLYNDLIQLSGRNSRNIKMLNEGRIDNREYNISHNNITHALNSYLEKYEPKGDFQFPTVETPKTTSPKTPTSEANQRRNSMKTVFLSYNHNDKEWANNIHSMLKDNGIEVIIDQVSTKPGQDLAEFSLESVKGSDFTISLISTNSLYSTWVLLETKDVLSAERMDGRSRFIPVYRDEAVFNNKTIKEIQIDLVKKEQELTKEISEALENNWSFDHLNEQRNNIRRLNFELPSFIAKLRKMKLIKISDGNFYNGVKEVVNYIKEEK